MSTFAAIGAVSSTLQSLLVDRLDPPPPALVPVPVTVGLPPEDAADEADPLVNLFLYRVCENAALKNQEPPGRGDRGAYGKPPLALNLHYLLTAYGTTKQPTNASLEDEVIAHYLLGSAMRILHDFAIVTPALETNGGGQILDRDLVGARERVKVSLQPISLEDLSKVWTALSRPFRASVAYEVTVVQIEPQVRSPHAQPVGPESPFGGPHIHVVAGLAPTIESLHGAGRAGAQVRAGETLVLEGEGLLGESTRVDIGGIPDAGQITSARTDRMTLIVPDDPRLAAGILSLRVSHGVEFGAPPQRRPTFVSNTVAFALVPRIDSVAVAGASPVVTVTGNRLMADGVENLALVGGKTVESSAYAAGSTATSITFPLPPGLAAGQPARVFVRVNGVQSIDAVTVTP
jgi:hypothetical protein